MATYTLNRGEYAKLDTAAKAMTIDIGNRGSTSFKSDLQEIWEGVQTDRGDMLAQSRTLQLAAQLLMQGESRRLAALSPDDDRVALLSSAASRIGSRLAVLDEEITVATVRVPMVKKTEALLSGRVTDNDKQSAGPVMVTLADENGKAIAGVPPVQADDAGYYSLVVPTDTAAALGPDRRLQLLLSHGGESVTTAAPVQLRTGSIAVHDIAISAAALETLKLRLPANLGKIVSPRAHTTHDGVAATGLSDRSGKAVPASKRAKREPK